MLDSETYIKERLNEQIAWYDKKSISCQKRYKILRNIEIISAALLTFFAGLVTTNNFFPYIVGFLGILISIIAGVLNLNKYQENWIEYRAVCETLLNEKYMYLANVGIYNVEYPFPILVERIESIISRENINWANLNATNQEKKNS